MTVLVKYLKTIGHYQLFKTMGVHQYWIKFQGRNDLYSCNEYGQLLMDGEHAQMEDHQGNCLNGLYVIEMNHIDVYV